MEDVEQKLQRLVNAGEWTADEKRWLLTYLDSSDNAALKEVMFRLFNTHLQEDDTGTVSASPQLLETIHQQIHPPRRNNVLPLWLKRTAAASVITLVLLGSLFWWRNSHGVEAGRAPVSTQKTNRIPQDILPGSNRAVLTLADGSIILLQDAQNGSLAKQGAATVLKFNGKLAYRAGEAQSTAPVFNSISTPRGGQYQVVLPDGSEVWLNSASSIRFPTVFAGAERRVEITGEAYFEIAKNPALPFVVSVGQSEIRVLGTHFNIMAYNDEGYLKTTLVEGSVNFVNGPDTRTLTPGQQSQLDSHGNVSVAEAVNLEQELAWKNGSFHFERAGIRSVMRQLARWYDVEVDYRQPPAVDLFHGEFPRNTPLSLALKALELTGKVHFEVQGRKIVVTSNE